MSLLIVTQEEDAVELLSDSLVVYGPDNVPVGYQYKVWPIPQLNMVIAATGTGDVAMMWKAHVEWLADGGHVRDIEDLNAHATIALRTIENDLAGKVDDAGTTSIYHYGFPTGSSRLVSYTYSSFKGKQFEPVRFEGGRFMVKPGPQTFNMYAAETKEEKIELANRIRDEQLAIITEGNERGVHIGGDLHATYLTNGNVQRQTWARFPDYDDALPSTTQSG